MNYLIGSGVIQLDSHCVWKGRELEPDHTSFDYENKSKEKHENRILLEAEPQIGKTGVYLRVNFTQNCTL